MEKDFKSSSSISQRFDLLSREALSNKDVEAAMFCFGFKLGMLTDEINLKLPDNEGTPFLKKFTDWDFDVLRKVQNASDDVDNAPDVPDGILFLVSQVNQAVYYNRPHWAYFYLAGVAKGNVNCKLITVTEFQYVMRLFSIEFIKLKKDKLLHVCNLLDTTGFNLFYELHHNNVLTYHENKR